MNLHECTVSEVMWNFHENVDYAFILTVSVKTSIKMKEEK